MFKKKILITSVLFCLFVSNVAYAASFAGQTTDISGCGKITWTEAATTIQDRIDKSNGKEIKYDYNLSVKESGYLVYVCTTHQVSYASYKSYADKFVADYKPNNLSFKVLTEAKYNENLEAMKRTIKNNESTNKTLIADSGFRVNKNGLPFSNIGVTNGSEGGLCAGFSSLCLLAYVEPDSLDKINFKNTKSTALKENDSCDKIYEDKSMKSVVKLKSYKEIQDKNLYAYQPDTEAIKKSIPHPILKIKEDVTTENYNDYLASFQNFNFDLIDLISIKGTKDFELVKGLHYFWSWNNFNFTNQQISLCDKKVYNTTSLCPTNELDLVLKEFAEGRPIELSIFSKDGGHSIIGYRLWQDKDDNNLFYIDVYDSNLPGNSTVEYSGYSPQMLVYKGTYGDRLALYYYYAPFVLKDNKVEVTYRFTDDLTFSDYKGRYLHTNNDSNWGESVEFVESIAY